MGASSDRILLVSTTSSDDRRDPGARTSAARAAHAGHFGVNVHAPGLQLGVLVSTSSVVRVTPVSGRGVGAGRGRRQRNPGGALRRIDLDPATCRRTASVRFSRPIDCKLDPNDPDPYRNDHEAETADSGGVVLLISCALLEVGFAAFDDPCAETNRSDMNGGYELERFVEAQDSGGTYERAVEELRAGQKRATGCGSCSRNWPGWGAVDGRGTRSLPWMRRRRIWRTGAGWAPARGGEALLGINRRSAGDPRQRRRDEAASVDDLVRTGRSGRARVRGSARNVFCGERDAATLRLLGQAMRAPTARPKRDLCGYGRIPTLSALPPPGSTGCVHLCRCPSTLGRAFTANRQRPVRRGSARCGG